VRTLVAIQILLVAVPASIAFSQAPSGPPKAELAPEPLTWDVISVKPNHSLNPSGSIGSSMDSLRIQNMTLISVFLTAFGLKSEDQIVGLPGWVNSDNFDIQAKMDVETASAFKQMRPEEHIRQWNSFLREVLENRFGLKFHLEEQERPVYNLVVTKQGLKIKESSSDANGSYYSGPDRFSASKCQMSSLVFSLTGSLDRVVIDKTGLTGRYDIDLTWSPDSEPNSGPSIFTALQEQLGLKLEPAKAPVDMIVIDHIERPSEN
jgi:uncharacterized protein (TIGR03435 family)